MLAVGFLSERGAAGAVHFPIVVLPAFLDAGRLGYSVICFAFVHLASQAESDLAAFQERVAGWPNVRECWTLSGDIDFLMKCTTEDLPSLQAFVSELTATPNVRNVRTALALGKVKDEGLVPMVRS